MGGASLVVLISLFLPWFGFSALGASLSISGTTAHGYLVLAVITALLIAGYLLLRSGWGEFPFPLPVAHESLVLAGTGVQFLLGRLRCAAGRPRLGDRRLPRASRRGAGHAPGRAARPALAVQPPVS